MALAVGTAACSSAPFDIPPSRDAGDEARKNPVTATMLKQPGARYIALCYGAQINSAEDLLAAARERCPRQGQVEVVTQDFFWNGCALAQPNRVTYLCVPGSLYDDAQSKNP